MRNAIYMNGVSKSGSLISRDGSGYIIGDGLALTAAHVVLEFNEKNALEDRQILSSPQIPIIVDVRQYRDAYEAAAMALDDPLSSPSNPDITLSMQIEATLTSRDYVVVAYKGVATASDAGLAVFLSPSDLVSTSAGVLDGANYHRYGKRTGPTDGSIPSLRSGGFHFSGASIGGDSGGAYTVKYKEREYVFGVQSAQITGGVNDGLAIGNYFTKSEWDALNFVLAASQTKNVTLSEPQNLVVGTLGADVFEGSYRADLLLGRDGDDRISDGENNDSIAWGDDILVGGADNDTFFASKGDDEVWGGEQNSNGELADGIDTIDYSNSSTPIAIKFSSNASGQQLTVEGDVVGTDTLHSIEKIIGTSGYDKITVIGHIPINTNLTIDANGGQSSNAFGSVINGSPSDTAFEVNIDGSGHGFIRSVGGGTINLSGFHTQFVGTSFGDNISDDSAGRKRLGGGGGDDIISTSGTSYDVIIYGGEGADELTGGSGNDIIVGDTSRENSFVTNWLNGGAGNDYLLGTSYRDQFSGGSGDDYIDVAFKSDANHVSEVRVSGGAGNDYINVAGRLSKVDVMFGVGSGKDVVNYEKWGWFQGTVSSPINIVLEGISADQVTLVYSGAPGQSGFGSLALVISATGESLYIPNVYGAGPSDNPLSSAFAAVSITINGQEPRFSGVAFQFGQTSDYALDPEAFAAAAQPSPQQTTGGSGNDDLLGGRGNDVLSGSPIQKLIKFDSILRFCA